MTTSLGAAPAGKPAPAGAGATGVDSVPGAAAGVSSTSAASGVPASAGPFTAGQPKTKPNQETREPVASSLPATLTVSVVDSGRVEVSVQLQDQTDLTNLVATELRPFAPDAPPIAEPLLTLRDERTLELQVVVPDGQVAGTYNGLLLAKQSQRPRGTINVVVVDR